MTETPNTPEPMPKPQRPWLKRFAGLVVLGWVVAIVAYLALVVVPGRKPQDVFDKIAIGREQISRQKRAILNEPLPGTPDLKKLDQRLQAAGQRVGAPVLVRIYKREMELELWLEKAGRFERFATYPICRFSGLLGPKLKEGDRQAPEGFYTVEASQLNPNSRWHRSFNLGFPNAYDRAQGRSGTFLMVHGGCTSIGCYAMTDAVIDEIWLFVTRAFANGQRRFQVQAFPFRMTDANLALRQGSQWFSFWSDLKAGADLFEATGRPPDATVCEGRYQFRAGRSGTPNEVVARCAPVADAKTTNAR
jgi:murein L,D-transpeptidase YafK